MVGGGRVPGLHVAPGPDSVGGRGQTPSAEARAVAGPSLAGLEGLGAPAAGAAPGHESLAGIWPPEHLGVLKLHFQGAGLLEFVTCDKAAACQALKLPLGVQ